MVLFRYFCRPYRRFNGSRRNGGILQSGSHGVSSTGVQFDHFPGGVDVNSVYSRGAPLVRKRCRCGSGSGVSGGGSRTRRFPRIGAGFGRRFGKGAMWKASGIPGHFFGGSGVFLLLGVVLIMVEKNRVDFCRCGKPNGLQLEVCGVYREGVAEARF